MTDAAVLPVPAVRGRYHDIMLVALIALRPLIWSGDASSWDNIAWLFLVGGALIALLIDAWRGRVTAWRFGVGGVVAALLLLILLPAAIRSPFPATGMGLWGMAVVHLGFAAYVLQVLCGRERLACAALVGAVIIECLVACGQWAWVLPGMTAALTTGDAEMLALENAHGDLAERLKNGGLFGTFTLANTLAAFLLLAGLPIVGWLWQARGYMRTVVIAVVLTMIMTGIGTASKGAAVACLLATVVVWSLHSTGRWRFVPLTALLMLAGIIALMPSLRDLGAGSAQVRLGYWQGALTLIAESPFFGHGINSFAAESARAMPLSAEPTQHVHNDILEASVDGGLLAGLVLALLLLWSSRTRPALSLPNTAAPSDNNKRTFQATWPLLIIFPFFAALGMLQTNLGWWPGGGEATWWLWPLIFSGIMVIVALGIARTTLPPAWAFQLALGAFALHCLIDFNLQSPAIWGTFIIVSILAGGRVYELGVCTISRSVVTVLVCALLAGVVLGVARDSGRRPIAPLAPTEITAQTTADMQHLVRNAQRWPARLDMTMSALANIPPSAERLTITNDLSEKYPWNGTLLEMLAQDCAVTGGYNDAMQYMEQAVATAPAYIPRRKRFISLMTRIAELQPSLKNQLGQRIDQQSHIIAELAPVVHQRNR